MINGGFPSPAEHKELIHLAPQQLCGLFSSITLQTIDLASQTVRACRPCLASMLSYHLAGKIAFVQDRTVTESRNYPSLETWHGIGSLEL